MIVTKNESEITLEIKISNVEYNNFINEVNYLYSKIEDPNKIETILSFKDALVSAIK